MNTPHSYSTQHTDTPTVIQPDKAGLIRRLNRIEGQVRGILRMIEDDRHCVDILTQVAAAKSALDAVALQLLHHHAQGCLSQAIHDGEGDVALSKLMGVMKRLL